MLNMAQIIGPSVRVADYALPSTKKIVRTTIKALKGRMAALMANHGAVCVGRDLDEGQQLITIGLIPAVKDGGRNLADGEKIPCGRRGGRL